MLSKMFFFPSCCFDMYSHQFNLFSLQWSLPSATIFSPCTTRRPARGIRPTVSSRSQTIPVSSCTIAWGKTGGPAAADCTQVECCFYRGFSLGENVFVPGAAQHCTVASGNQWKAEECGNSGIVADGMWNVPFGWEEEAAAQSKNLF